MFCIKCGAPLPEAAAFCPSCGTKVGADPGSENDRPAETGRSPAACAACGSRRFRRVRKGEYVCEHCGSSFFAEDPDQIVDPEETEARLWELFVEASEYEQKDDIPSELRVLLKGLDIAPDNCTLMLKLGRAYWRLGSAPKALEYYQKAEKLNPDDPVVYINLGLLYLTQKQYAQARPLMEKGLAIIEADPLSAAPNDIAVSYGNYGLCLGKLGDIPGAKKYLAIAKEKGYNPKSLESVCRQLNLNPRRL